MTARPKLIVFFLILSLPLFLTSCKKSRNDVIPTVVVNFTINLNDPLFISLLSPFTFAYVDHTTNNWGQASAGYDNNGIIVFRYTEDQFYAYDRTCPYDYVNGKSAKVNAVDMVDAVCPVCGTKYSLTTGGSPISGAGRYPLKNYRASFNGQFVNVYNY